MIEELGASGITLAVVAVIRQAIPDLSGRASMIVALGASVMVTAMLTLGVSGAWNTAPIQALQNWLVAMGAWSGGKALAGK